jgi:hypothetical protein
MDSTQKDIAVATAYFQSIYVEYETFFNSIDKSYSLALKFVEKYPVDTKWGVDEDLEYEETLYKFFVENNQQKIW